MEAGNTAGVVEIETLFDFFEVDIILPGSRFMVRVRCGSRPAAKILFFLHFILKISYLATHLPRGAKHRYHEIEDKPDEEIDYDRPENILHHVIKLLQ